MRVYLAEGNIEHIGEDMTIQVHGGGSLQVPMMRGFSGKVALTDEDRQQYGAGALHSIFVRGYTKNAETWQGVARITDVELVYRHPEDASPRIIATFESEGEWNRPYHRKDA